MDDKSKHFRRLKELREELAALTRSSLSTLTEIARIQLRIKELTDRLGVDATKDKPKSEWVRTFSLLTKTSASRAKEQTS